MNASSTERSSTSYSNDDAAPIRSTRALWLSPKTVETHIRGAFAKLGISDAPEDNRRVLAVLAYLGR